MDENHDHHALLGGVMRKTTTRSLWAALLCTAALVACGDDDDAAGSATTAGDDGAQTTTSEAAPGASGDPLKVYVIEDSSESAGLTFPSVRAGIEARVARINELGLGGSGRPLEVVYCTTDFDPNAAAECAREAAGDPDVIAVAGSISANGDTVLPILEEAGIAHVGGTAFAATDGQNPVSFPTMGGLVAASGCQATIARDQAGANELAVAYGDTPGADAVVGLLGLVLQGSDASVANQVVVPIAQPDYSAELGAVTSGADALIMATDGLTAQKIVRQSGQVGVDIPLVGSGGQSFTPEVLADLGDAAEGMYVSLWYATDDTEAPGVEQYLDDMEAHGSLDLSDDLSKLGWVAFELLDQAATGLDTIDRTTILETLNSMSAFDSGGLTPMLDFTTPGTLVSGPRFVNDTCVYAQVDGGAIVGVSDGFVEPFGA